LSALDAYRTLGVEPGATLIEVEQAYHRLIRVHHPDVGGSTADAAALNDAYKVVRRLLLASQEATPLPTTVSDWSVDEDMGIDAKQRRPWLIHVVARSALLLFVMRMDFGRRYVLLRPRLIVMTSRRRERLRRQRQGEYEDYWWERYSSAWDAYGPLPSKGRRGLFDYPRARLFEGIRL
jgi:hypothetical protein